MDKEQVLLRKVPEQQKQKSMPEKLEEGVIFRFNAVRYKVQRVRKNGTMIVKELKTVKH